MTVLAVGDSVSFGYELSDVPGTVQGVINQYLDPDTQQLTLMGPSLLAFPQLMADRRGTDCENLSLIGGSNDRTFRITADRVLQRRYDLVICCWTSLDRFDFVSGDQDLALNVASSPWQTAHYPWLRSYIADHHNPGHMTHRFYAQLLALQALLQQLAQPYVFVNGCAVQSSIPDHHRYQHYAQHRDTSRYFLPDSDLTSLCRWQGLAFGPSGHFLEAGHSLVADQLEQFLS